MRNQLYWVGLTYVRRPLFWVATLLLVVVAAYGILTSSNHKKMRSSYPRFKAEGLRVHSYEEFQKLRDEGRLEKVGSLNFGSLLRDKRRHLARQGKSIQGRAAHLDEIVARELLEECAPATEIEKLASASLLLDLDLNWSSRFPKLRYFETFSLPRDKPWVAQFEKLPKLERLSIYRCKSIEGLSRLAKLGNFQTLELDNIQQFSDHDLREISQLPQLRTLILELDQVANAPKPNEPKNLVTDAGLALLRDMPNLRTVYVNRSALERVRSILPNKRVLRANYSESRIFNLMRIEFALAFLLAVLYFQIAGQASLFLGRIAPRRFSGHLIVPIGILAVAIALGTACLSTGDSQRLPALAACLLLVAGMAYAAQIVLTTEKMTARNAFARIAILGCAPLTVLAAHDYFGPEIDAFLIGDFPRICAAILGLSCLAIVMVFRRLAQLPLRLAISGKTMSVSLADLQTSFTANNHQNQKNKQPYCPQRIMNGYLDRHIAHGFHGNQPAQRISLWYAAAPGMGRSYNVFFNILVVAFFGFVFVRERNDPDGYLALALVAPLAVSILGLFSLSISWHSRLKSFAYELLRPVSRRSLRSDFFRSLIGDLGASLLITLPLACIAYFLWKDAATETRPWTASFCFCSMGALIFGVGIFSSIALIRKSWLAITAFALLYLSFLFFFAISSEMVARWELTLENWIRVALALALLGSTALAFAWRRFLKIEWGKHA